MARPKIVVDAEEVRKLAALGCKTQEIADFFECSHHTILRRFEIELAKGRSELKTSLRRSQIEVALKGNPTMLIWLGKQMLGQVERTQIDITKIDNETFMREAKRRLEDGLQDGSDPTSSES